MQLTLIKAVKGVNITLLRKQRDTLLEIVSIGHQSPKEMEALEGLIMLCDEMLDIAEGFKL